METRKTFSFSCFALLSCAVLMKGPVQAAQAWSLGPGLSSLSMASPFTLLSFEIWERVNWNVVSC